MSKKTNPKLTERQKVENRLMKVASPGLTDSLALEKNSMFTETEGLDEGMQIKSRSPLLKPDKFPVGKTMKGIIKRLTTCIAGQTDDGKDKAGCLVEIVPTLDTVGYAVPAVATIMSALDIKLVSGEGKNAVFETPYINHKVNIEKLPERVPSKKGQDAWMFLVAVSPEPVV